MLLLISMSGPTLFSGSCYEQIGTEIRDAFLAGTNVFVQSLTVELLADAVGVDDTMTDASSM